MMEKIHSSSSNSNFHKKYLWKHRLFILSILLILLSYIILQALQQNSKYFIIPTASRLFSSTPVVNEGSEMATASNDESWKNAKAIYEFKANDIDGNLIDLSKYKLVYFFVIQE